MEHNYKVKDLSILTPGYTKLVIDPLMKFIPGWLPANIITIASNSCVLLALLLTIFPAPLRPEIKFIVPLLIMIYATGDFIDGKQARRSGTGSKLGEFLDHFLDIFATGMLIAIFILIYGISDPLIISIYFFLSYITVSSIYFEQYKNKMLFFEKLGAFEAIILFTALITLGSVENIRLFLTSDRIAFISIIDLITTGLSLGAFITLLRSIKRTGGTRIGGFFLFSVISALTAYLSSMIFSGPVLMIILTAYCGNYIGKLHTAYLINSRIPFPDIIFPVFIALGFIINIQNTVIINLSLTYLFICVLLTFISGFIHFRNFWVWINPEADDKPVDAYSV